MNCYQTNSNVPPTSGNLYKDMPDKELQQKLTTETNPRTQLRILIELNTRQARQIAALTNRIALLEDKALKKAGRKRVTLYLDGKELTDDDILYYIDGDYFTISQLEHVTGAHKNQIRNRYNRAKKKQLYMHLIASVKIISLWTLLDLLFPPNILPDTYGN